MASVLSNEINKLLAHKEYPRDEVLNFLAFFKRVDHHLKDGSPAENWEVWEKAGFKGLNEATAVWAYLTIIWEAVSDLPPDALGAAHPVETPKDRLYYLQIALNAICLEYKELGDEAEARRLSDLYKEVWYLTNDMWPAQD